MDVKFMSVLLEVLLESMIQSDDENTFVIFCQSRSRSTPLRCRNHTSLQETCAFRRIHCSSRLWRVLRGLRACAGVHRWIAVAIVAVWMCCRLCLSLNLFAAIAAYFVGFAAIADFAASSFAWNQFFAANCPPLLRQSEYLFSPRPHLAS